MACKKNKNIFYGLFLLHVCSVVKMLKSVSFTSQVTMGKRLWLYTFGCNNNNDG